LKDSIHQAIIQKNTAIHVLARVTIELKWLEALPPTPNKTFPNAVVTCKIKIFQNYFSHRHCPSEIIVFRCVETCLELFQNYFTGLLQLMANMEPRKRAWWQRFRTHRKCGRNNCHNNI